MNRGETVTELSKDNDPFDIKASRSIKNYSHREILARILWRLAQPFFFLSPRLLYRWRNSLLRLFGASIGPGVRIHQSAKIRYPWLLSIGDHSSMGENAMIYNLGFIQIGERVTVSQNAHLCAGTHEYRAAEFPLVRSTIEVGDDCWICADAFVGPGVIVGNSSIVAARAVVVKNVSEREIVGGNPAKVIRLVEHGTGTTKDS